MAPSLDVHRTSPVRGQLEPHDPRTPNGSRYIQTSDTPDELKVLLPPGTATMYEQLLKLEAYELSKKPSVNWERILEIRHLKERMIRKCQKLAKTEMPMAKKSSRGDAFVFQTFVAPSDFRCKEMERWFRDQQKRALGTSATPKRTITAGGHIQEISSSGLSRHVSSSSKNGLQRSITNPESSSTKQVIYNTPLPTIQSRRRIEYGNEQPSTSYHELLSPPPLPVLLLSVREELGYDDAPQPLPTNPVPDGVSHEEGNPSSLPANDNLPPALSRRPSCIKRNSIGDIKSVSWADNNNDMERQLSQYAKATGEAQDAGKWDELRVLYLDQLAGLEKLHFQVRDGLDHLRSETEHLQRIDETIRKQRELLDATFHDFEHRQTLLQEKVQEALTEANNNLSKHVSPPKESLETIRELT